MRMFLSTQTAMHRQTKSDNCHHIRGNCFALASSVNFPNFTMRQAATAPLTAAQVE